ncbi:MAG: PAS domain S-box protein, partial [Synergistaceae bacterium]|nr:PAS domain S-box protein [Synergistaceae bacterium]
MDVKSSVFSSQGDSPACGEQLLKDLFFNNPSVMFILHPESGAILEANDAALSFYGYPRKHLQSLKITDLDASLAVQVPSIEERQKGTMAVFQRTRHRLASGKNREVEIQKAPLEWKGLKALYAVVRDISEIIFVQEKFDAKSAFLEQLFQNSPIPIQQCSMD